MNQNAESVIRSLLCVSRKHLVGSTVPGGAFLTMGFRPLFLVAAVWASVTMVSWILLLFGQLSLPSTFGPVSWHAHEALYGYLSAVAAGFLLTAVPNWTGRPPLSGHVLLGPVFLWFLGRFCIAVSGFLPAILVAGADLSVLVVIGGFSLREIILGKNWRNLVVIALVAMLVLGNALFHWEVAQGRNAASGYGLRTGLAAAIIMISLIGGRIVPSFTRNWLVQRGSVVLPARPSLLDRIALVLGSIAMAFWVAVPDWFGTGCLQLAAGLVVMLRWSRWCGTRTLDEPLLWILHAGYACVSLGMLGMGSALVMAGPLSTTAAQHIWMTGAIGLMTLAVMTRASLGHTGRALTAGPGTTVIYLSVMTSVVVRLLVSGQTGTSRLAVDDQHLFSDHLNSVNPVTTDGDKAHGERHFTITTHPTARSCAEP